MALRSKSALALVPLLAAMLLAGCSTSPSAEVPAAVEEAPAEKPAEKEEAPKSEIEESVAVFTEGLDALGIEYTEPVRAEVGLSGAKARFDMTVNGYDAGINVFPDAEMLATWGEASDSFGGIYVAHGNAVISLNSSEGIADSAQIAPLIAEQIGGEAHGV